MDRPTAQEKNSKWIGFLTPEILRGKLISASVYLAAFELLKDSIIDHPRTFFASGFDRNGIIDGPNYQSEILARNRSPLYASLYWLREMNAVDDKDLETFDDLRSIRNRVAHEMHQLVAGGSQSGHLAAFPKLVALLRKIEVWWIVNVELPTNPDFDGSAEVDEDGILPGSVMAAAVMCDVALGSDEEASRYIKAFQESGRKTNK